MTDTSSGAYAAGEYTSVAYDVALGASVGWAAGGTRIKGVTEFSHWIPDRVLKRTGSKWLRDVFGWSKFNGNYVTKARHAMHDTHKWKFMSKSFKKANVDHFPFWLQQIDRVPRVYYGIVGGGAYGAASMWFGDNEK